MCTFLLLPVSGAARCAGDVSKLQHCNVKQLPCHSRISPIMSTRSELNYSVFKQTFASLQLGFTLVEILIAVVIAAILASIIVPYLGSSTDEAQYVGTVEKLRILREAIQLYRNQHQGRLPGEPGAFPDRVFVEQLTLPTNELGERSRAPDRGFGDPRYPFGPYLSWNQIPYNPFNGSNSVMTVRRMPVLPPGGTSTRDPGWIYDISSGRIKINYRGRTPDGLPYWQL